jgi:urease accessory protein UreF
MRRRTGRRKRSWSDTHHEWSCTYRTSITFRLLHHAVVFAVVVAAAGVARATAGLFIVVAVAIVVVAAAGRL